MPSSADDLVAFLERVRALLAAIGAAKLVLLYIAVVYPFVAAVIALGAAVKSRPLPLWPYVCVAVAWVVLVLGLLGA